VLNAKNNEREASIVAQAGRKGVVTVSTNMAGRGTDILLGGNPEFMTKDACLKEKLRSGCRKTRRSISPTNISITSRTTTSSTGCGATSGTSCLRGSRRRRTRNTTCGGLGGLHIVGTERHESRRIDNQLRGRAGRQGDPGSSKFFLSLQDDLLRIFGGQRMQNLMLRLGMEEDVPIESKLITRRIAKAQEAVEVQNFEARKHLLEYDDVNNKQRQACTACAAVAEGADQKEHILDMARGIVEQSVDMAAQ